MKEKLKLNQCNKCRKTYNPNEFGTCENNCCSCNTKVNNERKRKDALRKCFDRKEDNSISSKLERLGDICE